MNRKRLYYVIMPFIMALTLLISLFAPLVPTTLSSAAEIQATGLSASDATVTDDNSEPVKSGETTYESKSYTVTYKKWSIPKNIDIKNGDTITFTIPSNVKIIKDQSTPVTDANNNTIGTAQISVGSSTGTITITNAENVKRYGRTGQFQIAAGGTTVDHNTGTWMINKATLNSTNSDELSWQILYNPDAQKISNAIITDKLQKVTNQKTHQLEFGQTYVEGSVKVYKGTVDKANNNQFSQSDDITNEVNINIDNDTGTLTVSLGNISTAIYITYSTKPNSDFKGIVKNEASDNSGNSDFANNEWQVASGNIDSYAGSVSLKKVSSTNSNQTLEGAVFKIVKYDNDKIGDTVVYDLTTDKNGEISYDELPTGKFAFIETKAPDGYELDTNPHSFEISKENNYSARTITVADKPTESKPETTSLTVTKVWNDSNDKVGKRPSKVQVQLYANDEKSGDPITLSSSNNWKHTFSDLAKTDKDGKTINYTVREVNVPEDYTSETKTDGNNVTITNTYKPTTPPVEETTSLSVNKVWNDNNNAAGLRPSEVQVQLYANGKKSGDLITLNLGNNWSYDFTNLPEKDADGNTITYTVKETTELANYTSAVDSSQTGKATITNTFVQPTKETTSLTVNKVWEDSDNQDNTRPSSVTVKLLANGKETGKSVELSGDNNWTATFSDLDKKDDSGNDIKYTVEEVKVDGYTSKIGEVKDNQVTITNTHTPTTPPTEETTSLTVNKVWNDDNNKDGKRPTSITVHLLADGADTGKTVTLSEKNNWTASFDKLAINKNGKKITYTVKEDTVSNYASEVGDVKDGQVTITNTYTPAKPTTSTTELKVNKVWNDNNNAAGLRPSEVQVQLYANGEKSGEPVTLNLGNNWSYDFTNLPEKDANGNTITYTVKEVNTISDYVSTIDNSQKGQVTITNTYIPPTTPTENKTSYTVNKIWNDDNNKDGKRPESVQVQLYANGEKSGEPITLSSANGWAYTFSNLPKTDQNGNAIKYTAKEVNVADGYTSSVDVSESGKATITNTYTPTTPNKPDTPSTPIKPSTPTTPTKPTTPSTSNFPTHSTTLTNSSSGNFQPKSEENTTQKLLNKLLPQTGSSITNALTYIGLLVIAMVIILSGVRLAKRNK